MAKITFSGTDDLSIGLSEIANLTDDDTWKILYAGAEILEKTYKNVLSTKFKQHTGDLAKSPKITKKFSSGQLTARIQPSGKHKSSSKGIRGRSRATPGIKYAKHNRKATAKYEATNAEVAYILEYGSPRIAATHWMEYANEEAESDVIAAEAAAWDDHLKNKGF